MSDDKLIRMATQMAQFFRSQPDMPPEQAVAAHINQFWSYRMRRDLIDRLATGTEVDPIVAAAAELIETPASRTDASISSSSKYPLQG